MVLSFYMTLELHHANMLWVLVLGCPLLPNAIKRSVVQVSSVSAELFCHFKKVARNANIQIISNAFLGSSELSKREVTNHVEVRLICYSSRDA